MALQFTLNTVTPSTINADCVVVGLFANGSLSASGTIEDLIEAELKKSEPSQL